MLIWLNGTFGAGKTTTAAELVATLPGTRLLDPEWTGYLVREYLKDHEVSDFQHLPPWRALVPAAIAAVVRFTGQHVVAPQTVLHEAYWAELRAGFAEHDLEVFHVLLDADPGALSARIAADLADPTARGWRLDHLGEYATARTWMLEAADLVVDTTSMAPPAAAGAIAGAVRASPRWTEPARRSVP